jgi:CRISPR-associated endonuclease Cas3-HD
MSNEAAGPYWGHSENKAGNRETVIQHMQRVADLAEVFTAAWGSRWEGQAAGMLHDLGKYGELFQDVLRGKEHGIDHSTPGALAALQKYGLNGVAVALAIQGHHGGLVSANNRAFATSLNLGRARSDGLRYSSTELQTLFRRYEADDGSWPPGGCCRTAEQLKGQLAENAMLDARMLFSALVDADYLATEAHFEEEAEGYRCRPPGPLLEPGRALELLLAHVARLQAGSHASDEMRSLRSDLMQACLAAGKAATGIFSLTAPTGSGKTLAMMGFALQHAHANGLRRVIVVLPYLNIIEQSARVYEEVLSAAMPKGYVLQDHSLAGDPGGDEDRLRLAAQNWDAPIIITTTVRFFESLFANRPADCRKLHNLANSVILFDETQTMPVDLAVPTLAALIELADGFGCSVVFSTATQPALEPVYMRAQAEKRRSRVGWHPREIAAAHLQLFARARRVEIKWPEGEISWEDLADDIAAHAQALAIVNLRRHAMGLFRAVQQRTSDGSYHLSTNMCPAHRLAVLCEVRRRLRAGLPCRLIATQCVEAGVDLDFPEVWRALAPLDAIAQAAGRCNREGRWATGLVHVFRPPGEQVMYPSSEYEQATVTLQQMLKKSPALNLHDPAVVSAYFDSYYAVDRPEERIKEELESGLKALDFQRVAQAYRWIDGTGASVLVPFAGQRSLFVELSSRARAGDFGARWMHEATALTVGVRGRQERSLTDIAEEVHTVKDRPSGWYLLLQESAYNSETGLDLAEGPADGRYLV